MNKKTIIGMCSILILMISTGITLSYRVTDPDGTIMECSENPDNPDWECCDPVSNSDPNAANEVSSASSQTPATNLNICSTVGQLGTTCTITGGQPGHYVCINDAGLLRYGTSCRSDTLNCRKITPTENLVTTQWIGGVCAAAYAKCEGCENAQQCYEAWSSQPLAASYLVDKAIIKAYGNLNQQQCTIASTTKRRMVINFPRIDGVTLTGCTVDFGGLSSIDNGCNTVTSPLRDTGQTYMITISFQANGQQKIATKTVYLESEQTTWKTK